MVVKQDVKINAPCENNCLDRSAEQKVKAERESARAREREREREKIKGFVLVIF